MTNLDKIIKHFERFPGIGGRQARRFAFHILTLPDTDVAEISDLLKNLQSSVIECSRCHRFFSNNGGSGQICSICTDGNRDRSKLMVVERDTDVQSIERSGIYDGLYFVLGGTIPLLESAESNKLRGGALKSSIDAQLTEDLKEIILGFSVNPDGENTGRYVEALLKEKIAEHSLTITQLGRGLSTGSELEYADPETIKNALRNRS
ncbi:MAG: recombination protein RecR [Patiriisocius sp.]|jgi:recombination protein RecR